MIYLVFKNFMKIIFDKNLLGKFYILLTLNIIL